MVIIRILFTIFIFILSFFTHLSFSYPKSCDEKKWASSSLINKYHVTMVLTVDSKGCGNYTKVQDAINTVRDSTSKTTLIIINTGTYREKVVVQATKTNLIIQGQGYLSTAIEWNDTANSSGGTFYSSTFTIFASKFTAYNISFKNTAPPANQGDVGAQAVALRVGGDQTAFYGCGMYGAQDTLHDDLGRHYYKECFIQGSIDFIFGNARSFFQDCFINSIANPKWTGDGGFITAHGQEALTNNTGFAFLNCHITGTGKVLLGRPWRQYAKVIFSKSYMSNVVAPRGWNDILQGRSVASTIFFAEYNSVGPGAIKKSPPRHSCGKQLTDEEAAPYISISYINGADWLHQF